MVSTRTLPCGGAGARYAVAEAMEATEGITSIVSTKDQIWGVTGILRKGKVLPSSGVLVLVYIGDAADGPSWAEGASDDESESSRTRGSITALEEQNEGAKAESETDDDGKADDVTTDIHVKTTALSTQFAPTLVIVPPPMDRYHDRFLSEFDTVAEDIEPGFEPNPLEEPAYPGLGEAGKKLIKREAPVYAIVTIIIFLLPLPGWPLPGFGFLVGVLWWIYRISSYDG